MRLPAPPSPWPIRTTTIVRPKCSTRLGRRLWLIGHSGAGKTTCGCFLARTLQLPAIHLDTIVWRRGWRRQPDDLIRTQVLRCLRAPSYVVEGTNLACGPELADSVDDVLWLDLPLSVLVPRIICRTIRRCWTKEEVTPGNRERWLDLLSPRALWLKVLCSYASYRRRVFQLLAHRPFTRICSFPELAVWLQARGLPDFPNPEGLP